MEMTCETRKGNPPMGTIAWGRRSGRHGRGRLTGWEKAKLLLNLVRISACEVGDTVLDRFGLMRTCGSDLQGLMPDETPLVRDALDFADATQNAEIMQHSWRTYLWGMLLGGYRRLDIDREILFSASILHDVGLASGRLSEPCDCCFAIYGAERCRHHLVGKGHDRAKTRRIADAIGVHLNAYVSERVHGVEAHLLSRGAMCDVFSMGRRRIDGQTRREVFASYPKGDLVAALEIWQGHHLRDTRADFLLRVGGTPGPEIARSDAGLQAGSGQAGPVATSVSSRPPHSAQEPS